MAEVDTGLNLAILLILVVGVVYVIRRDRKKDKARGSSGENYRDHQPKPPTQER